MFFGSKRGAERFLVVGLGNPGLQYEKTRHNAGFEALDLFSQDFNIELSKHRFDAVFGEGKIGDSHVIAAKPQTYMNLSGKAVSALSRFYKIPVNRIIIISDDISLPVGNIRIRRKGSAGGHNGLKDIFELMGTEEITRIKIGVGGMEEKSGDLVKHVLGKIPAEKAEIYENAKHSAAKAAADIIKNGVDHAMNEFSK